jgi:hypothetical protein
VESCPPRFLRSLLRAPHVTPTGIATSNPPRGHIRLRSLEPTPAMRQHCISTLTNRPGGSPNPLTSGSRRLAGPPGTRSCQASELRFSRGVQTEALDASCGPRRRTWHPGPPPPPLLLRRIKMRPTDDAPARRNISTSKTLARRRASTIHRTSAASSSLPLPSVVLALSHPRLLPISSAAAGKSTGYPMAAATAVEIGGFAAAHAFRPASPTVAAAAPPHPRRAVAARELRTATTEKAADLAAATNGALPAVVSESLRTWY